MAEQLKATVEQLGIDPDTLTWQRSGAGDRVIEVAFTARSGQPGREHGDWVLMRTGSPSGPVLVFTRFEWECFLDGVKKGEFDDAAQ